MKLIPLLLLLVGCSGARASAERMVLHPAEEVTWHFPVDDVFVTDLVGASALTQCRERMAKDASSCSVHVPSCGTLIVFADRSVFELSTTACGRHLAHPEQTPLRHQQLVSSGLPLGAWMYNCQGSSCGSNTLASARAEAAPH